MIRGARGVVTSPVNDHISTELNDHFTANNIRHLLRALTSAICALGAGFIYRVSQIGDSSFETCILYADKKPTVMVII